MNWWHDDASFRRALTMRLDEATMRRAEPLLQAMGGEAPVFYAPRARLADRHRPQLERYDRTGARVDRISYHPAYQEMTRAAYGSGIVRPRDAQGPLPHLVKFGLGYLLAQAEAGLYCPIACTDGLARVLERFAPKLAATWVPRLTSTGDDLLQGAMFMTEKAGGSDLAQVQTVARRDRDAWRLYGEKWFCSNVDAGLILTIARTSDEPGTSGLSMFLVPSHVDGERNAFGIERLKDKLGFASMPTGEVAYDGTLGWLVGEEGKGIRCAAELFNLSRVYNAIASVALAKRALREAMDAARERIVFGEPVARQPLGMQDLTRLTVELEANLALVFETAAFLDRVDAGGSEHDRKMLRILTPIAKLVTARFAVRAASEAIELRGGNGYIEDFDTPRLLRDAQVFPIWEGTTNVMALDAVRSMRKEGTLEALLADLRGRLPQEGGKLVHQALDRLAMEAHRVVAGEERGARRLVERLALCYRAALLLEDAASDGERTDRLARLYIDGFLAPGMEEEPLDLSEGYDELIGL